MWRHGVYAISPWDTSNKDNSRCSHKVQMFHFWKALSNSPQPARSERAHSCEMVSFHCLSPSAPLPQPTLGHRWTCLAITSLMHRFKNSTGQMTFGGLCYPSSRKGKFFLPLGLNRYISSSWAWSLLALRLEIHFFFFFPRYLSSFIFFLILFYF